MNELAVTIGIILFPGLITCIICDKIAAHSPRWTTFKYSIYSFVFGVLCYIAVQVFYSIADLIYPYACGVIHPTAPSPLRVWSIIVAPNGNPDIRETAFATLAAPFVAFVATAINNYKVLNRIAKKLKVSFKYGDENLFSYYLNSRELDWVYVRDPITNHTYQGRLSSWSENDHIQEIVLFNVTVYVYETSQELYSLPTLYLAKPTGSFIIEVIPPHLLEPANGKEAAS